MEIDAEIPALAVADAERALAGHELVTAMAGSIPDMKALRDRCLAAGIPATIGCPGAGGSCGPKTHLLVAEAALPQIAALFRDTWSADLEREGLAPVPLHMAGEDAEPPCPACGTAAPLVDGCCSDCGLQLA